MLKTFSLLVLFCFTLQILTPRLWAYSASTASIESPSAPEIEPSQQTSEAKTKDEEFSERSQRGSKFAFSDLPRHLGYNIKESVRGWGSLGLAVGIGITAGLHAKDKEIVSGLNRYELFSKTGDKIINTMGAPYTMAGIGILTTIAGAGLHNEKLLTTSESVLEALFWTETLTIGLQFAFRRTRPDGSKRGFPSGHTSGAFSTATVFEVMYGPKVGIPLYAFATLVALARVDSFKHFPSDVLMGAALGTVIGYGTARFHKKLHHNFVIAPNISSDHYGLLLHHTF